MSPYETNLSDFIYILKTRPDLLSAEDWLSLEELLQRVHEDLEEFSNAITTWYESRPAIDDAIMELPMEEADDRAMGGNQTKPQVQEFKKIIKNQTDQHKPKSNPPPPPTKPKK